jgi:hypothetical protein
MTASAIVANLRISIVKRGKVAQSLPETAPCELETGTYSNI